MWGSSEKVRLTKTTKDPKVKAVGRGEKNIVDWCGEVDGLTWLAVEKIRGSG